MRAIRSLWKRSAGVAGALVVLLAQTSPAHAYSTELERSWFEAAGDLGRRATAARLTALELGHGSVDAAALALISPVAARIDSGTDLGRALLAVRLAPHLPMAHVALARARWADGDRRGALESGLAGLAALPRHLEALFWLLASVLSMFTLVLVVGSLGFIATQAVAAASHAAHDLGDPLSRQTPSFSRAALLAALVLLPLALGEGVLGVVVVLFAVGFVYGQQPQRNVLVLAAALLVLGMYPVTLLAGKALMVMESDPVADAGLALVRGTAGELEIERLEALAEDDSMARHLLAVRARQQGKVEEALTRYEALERELPRDPYVLANLANLRFERGETEAALALYERASGLVATPTLLFDLSQAYARSFRMEEFEQALARAQALDPEVVAELSRIENSEFVADLPYPEARLRDRLIETADGAAFASVVSRPLAPGRLGESWLHTAGGFGAAALLGMVLASRFERSSRCTRCGARICARCDGTVWNNETCEACHGLFHRPENTDPSLRTARLQALKRREERRERIGTLAALVVPGFAGLWARRPDLSLVSWLCACWAVAAIVWRDGVVEDPLTVGAAGTLAFLITGVIALLGHLGSAGVALLVRRSL